MQDYKLLLRSLTAGQTQLDATGQISLQNASEFMSYLNEQYLSQGYKVQSVDLLSKTPVESGLPIYEFAYHLVKEYAEK